MAAPAEAGDEASAVGEPGAGIVQGDFGVTGGARAFVCRDFEDTVAGGEGGHDHFHLNRGVPRTEIEATEDVGADGAKTVLRIRQAGAEAAIDQVGDEGGTGEAEKFVAAAVKLVGAAEEAGAGDVFGFAGFDGSDEKRDIDRIVRAVGVDENADVGFDVSDGFAERGAFAAAGIADDAGAGGGGDGGGVIGGAAFDDEDVSGVVEALADDGSDGGGFVARGDDSGDFGIGLLVALEDIDDGDGALAEKPAHAKREEAMFAVAEAENVVRFGHLGRGQGRREGMRA